MEKESKHITTNFSPLGQADVRLKVCGMNKNPEAVAQLRPDYLGFIFWEPSKRSFDGDMPQLDPSIKKVGVFVDAPIDEVLDTIKTYNLQAVQLHGHESPEYCDALRKNFLSFRAQSRKRKVLDNKVSTALDLTIIKVFSINPDGYQGDFSMLEPFEDVCDYYLFDTKGKLPGGNGYTFDWTLLKDYPSTKPYFLSGGIGLEEIESVKEFLKRPEAKYCHAIDVNSRFEIEPGLKNIEKLKEFKKTLNQD